MNGQRFLKAGLLVSLGVSLLALGACCKPTPPTPPVERTVAGGTPTEVPVCGAAGTALAAGPFEVYPQPSQVCLQPVASWQEQVGYGYADWGYGVGTFLDDGAIVLLPDDEGEITMQPDTEIQLPDSFGSPLELIAGTMAIYWYKTVGNISAIISGGEYIDPDYVVMEVTTDPEEQTTEISVYGGEVTVTVMDTGKTYPIQEGSRVLFAPEVDPVFEPLTGQPSPEIEDLLALAEERMGAAPDELQYWLDPNYGEVDLNAGFMPDPYTVSIVSDGSVDVEPLELGDNCVGYATSAPDFRVNWEGAANNLFFYFRAEDGAGDTVLIVNDAAAQWRCNDDYFDLDPLVGFENPSPGQYDIWVSSYSSDVTVPGTLYITEIAPIE